MDPTLKNESEDIEREYQRSLGALHAALNDVNTSRASLESTHGDFVQRLAADRAATKAASRPPAGFIELTQESNKEKVLVAMHTICMVESAGHQEPEAPAKLLLGISHVVPGLSYTLKVEETYQTVLERLRNA